VRKSLSFEIGFAAWQGAPKRFARSLAAVLIMVVLVVAPAYASAGASGDSFEGFGLGLAVLVFLVIALIYAIVVVVLAIFDRWPKQGPNWIAFAIPILCVIGLGVAGYLSFVETLKVVAICGPVGDCNTVQSSPFARLFGLLPVGWLGLLGYVAILIAWTVGQLSKGGPSDLAAVAVFALALFGVLFSMYLTYLELAVILAVCMWCLASAVIMALLLILAVGPALARLAPVEELDS
jgi:uncharacterized membrane protein